jgi:hypothetical protein
MALESSAIIKRLRTIHKDERNDDSTGNDSFNAAPVKTFLSFQTASKRVGYCCPIQIR